MYYINRCIYSQASQAHARRRRNTVRDALASSVIIWLHHRRNTAPRNRGPQPLASVHADPNRPGCRPRPPTDCQSWAAAFSTSDAPATSTTGARIKGAERRAALKQMIQLGHLDDVPAFLSESALSDADDRQSSAGNWYRRRESVLDSWTDAVIFDASESHGSSGVCPPGVWLRPHTGVLISCRIRTVIAPYLDALSA